jgi:hypothetical protein
MCMQESSGEGAPDRAAAPGPTVVFTDECTAFVRNLPPEAGKKEVEDLFSDCEGIKDIRIAHDHTGRSKVCRRRQDRDAAVLPVLGSSSGFTFFACSLARATAQWTQFSQGVSCRASPMWTSPASKACRRLWPRTEWNSAAAAFSLPCRILLAVAAGALAGDALADLQAEVCSMHRQMPASGPHSLTCMDSSGFENPHTHRAHSQK